MRTDVMLFLEGARFQQGPSIVDLDPVVARAMLQQSSGIAERPARDMRLQDVSVPARDGYGVPVRLYFPEETTAPAPVLVFFHGGGWVLGDIEGYNSLASEIAYQSGLTVALVDYRLAPENMFPAAVHDSLDVVAWLAGEPEAIGHRVTGLILAGDSAGGTLAAVAAREQLGCAGPQVLAQWLIYPVTDLSQIYPSDVELSAIFNLTEVSKEKFYRYYLGDLDFEIKRRHPHVSPLLAEQWAGLPPAVIMACAHDPLRDQSRAYAARLVREGVPTIFFEADQVHASFTMRALLPSAQDDLLHGIAALRLLIDLPR